MRNHRASYLCFNYYMCFALRPVHIKFAIRIFYFRDSLSAVLWGGPRPDIATPAHRQRYLSTRNKLTS